MSSRYCRELFLKTKNYGKCCQKILLGNIFGKNLVHIVTCVLQFFHVPGYRKYSNKTQTFMQRCIGFADAALKPKILGKRLGNLTNILVSMDCYFLSHISEKYFQFRKKTKSFVLENFLVHPIQVTGSIYCENVFKLRITQRHVHKLERN